MIGVPFLAGQEFPLHHYVHAGLEPFTSDGYRRLFPPRAKLPGREVDYSHLVPTLTMFHCSVRLNGVVLNEAQGQLYHFTFMWTILIAQKILHNFYWTQRFSNVSTRTRHRSLFEARYISIHNHTLFCLKVYFNVILPPASWSSKYEFSRLPVSFSLAYSQNLWRSSLRKYIHFHVTSSLLGEKKSILSSTFLPRHPSFNVKEQVLNSYKTTGKVTVLHTFIFMFLNSRRKDKIFRTEW
jgi:hypothetical protein